MGRPLPMEGGRGSVCGGRGVFGLGVARLRVLGSVGGSVGTRGGRAGLAAVAGIGDVVARTLEDDAAGMEHLLKCPTAVVVGTQRLLGELLEHFQPISAVL